MADFASLTLSQALWSIILTDLIDFTKQILFYRRQHNCFMVFEGCGCSSCVDLAEHRPPHSLGDFLHPWRSRARSVGCMSLPWRIQDESHKMARAREMATSGAKICKVFPKSSNLYDPLPEDLQQGGFAVSVDGMLKVATQRRDQWDSGQCGFSIFDLFVPPAFSHLHPLGALE